MSREIKFRAITTENTVLQTVGKIEFFEDGHIIVNDEIPVQFLIQYIGRTLKDGIEIYEGDIYEYEYDYDSDYDGDMPIVYHAAGRDYVKNIWDNTKIFRAQLEGGTVRIIGNIYENPELLTN